MKSLNLIAAALLLCAAGAAQAVVVNWGIHGPLEIGMDLVAPGAFQDVYTFSLVPSENGLGSDTVANNLLPVTNIVNGSVSLYQGVYGDALPDTLLLQYAYNGTTGDSNHWVSNLAPGNYYYTVDGTATGSIGGVYTLTSTVVPEPESYALFVVGVLGLVAAKRRRVL